jgi:hypothetical protein
MPVLRPAPQNLGGSSNLVMLVRIQLATIPSQPLGILLLDAEPPFFRILYLSTVDSMCPIGATLGVELTSKSLVSGTPFWRVPDTSLFGTHLGYPGLHFFLFSVPNVALGHIRCDLDSARQQDRHWVLCCSLFCLCLHAFSMHDSGQ